MFFRLHEVLLTLPVRQVGIRKPCSRLAKAQRGQNTQHGSHSEAVPQARREVFGAGGGFGKREENARI